MSVCFARPWPGSEFALGDRSGPDAAPERPGVIVATIYTLTAAAAQEFTQLFERVIVPELAASGVLPFAVFETEPSPNTFPRLPGARRGAGPGLVRAIRRRLGI
jgi:hypothetical protein